MAKIVSLNCPKCGKESSEYQENKWKCLTCGSKFVYEPTQRPDHWEVVETRLDSFRCDGHKHKGTIVSAGKFGQNPCKTDGCENVLCDECHSLSQDGYSNLCLMCFNEKVKADIKAQRMGNLKAGLLVVLVPILMALGGC